MKRKRGSEKEEGRRKSGGRKERGMEGVGRRGGGRQVQESEEEMVERWMEEERNKK